MNIEDFRDFCLSMEGVTEKTPFGKFSRRFESILVFYILDHMFCFIDIDNFTSVTLKSTPEEIAEIRMRHTSVADPINMSPRHWLQINLNGDIPDSILMQLVRKAYEIVRSNYSNRKHKKPNETDAQSRKAKRSGMGSGGH